MSNARAVQSNFSRGEVSPELFGRVDTGQYEAGLKTAYNAIIHGFGSISNRPGLQFVGYAKHNDRTCRLIPFKFKSTDTHIIELGHEYIRFYRNDGSIVETAKTITNVTQADPAVVTTSGAHSYSNGDHVDISGVVGMTELNGRRFVVQNVTSTTFELVDVITRADLDSTGFTAYSSGGESARIVEIESPYDESDLRDIKYVQTADVVRLTHPSYPPKELRRTSLTTWTLTDISFKPSIGFPENLGVSGGTGSATAYTVTAISDSDEESLAGVTPTLAGGTVITGITAANPAVVTTSGAHGFTNGDRVWIHSVVGMTEVNDRQFVIANTTSTTFELLSENSSGYTAYSSGGVVNETFVSHTADTNVTITWNSVADAVRYRVFKLDNGVFGFIGSTQVTTFTDTGSLTPDTADTPPVLFEPFTGADNRPGAVGFHQQRLVMGGSNNDPDTSRFSVIGSFNNFSSSVPVKSTDGFSTTLDSNEINVVNHYVSLRELITFTSGAEWVISSTSGDRFSNDTVLQQPHTYWGSGVARPIVIGDNILYTSETNNSVRTFGFLLQKDGFTSDEISFLVPHLFRNKTVKEWALVKYPEPYVYMVRDDGIVLCLTFNAPQELIAWSRWQTDGDFESVASIRPSITADSEEAYFVVKRTIGNNTVRYIERTHERDFDFIEDAFFVDSGLTLDNPITISSTTAANPVVVTTSSAHGLSDGDEVDISDIVWEPTVDGLGNEVQPSQLNGQRFTVANSTSTTFELQSEDGSAFNAYKSGGNVRLVVSSLSGLHNLAGQTVSYLADGSVNTGATVSATGTLTLARGSSRVHVGLPYTFTMQTLSPELDDLRSKGAVHGRQVRPSKVIVRVERTVGFYAGTNGTNLVPARWREDELLGQPTQLFTGDKEVNINGTFSTDAGVMIRQIDPLPISVLMLTTELTVGGR